MDAAKWKRIDDILQAQFLGARPIVAGISNNLVLSLGAGFFLLFFLCLFRALLRRDWAAAVAFVLVLSVASPVVSPDAATAFVVGLILYGLTVVSIIRFGLLALAAWLVFQACLVENFPVTTQLSSWYAGIGLAGILLMAMIAGYSFYTSLGGQPIFGSAMLDE